MGNGVRGAFLLVRPGNVGMAALGALAGAFAAPGDVSSTLLIAVVWGVMFGVAGGNAINDARDAEIDKHAHPERPIPRGDLTPRDANIAGIILFAASYLCFGLTGRVSVQVLAVVFIASLYWYEVKLKARGLSGNILISILVGGTFLLGAFGASSDTSGWLPYIGWTPFIFALLAALVNLARELYKDLQDQEFDAAWRATLPLKMGARTAFTLARTFLLLAIFFGLLPAALRYSDFDRLYLLLVLPALSVFAVTIFVTEAGRAAFWTKMGMLLALVGFVATGLL